MLLGLTVATSLMLVSYCRVKIEYAHDDKACWAIATTVFLMAEFSIFLGVAFSIAIDYSGLDAADGAAPLLTTISDLIGITLLCGISTWYMS
mmetsp:Transcript_19967/g.27100  ORF Transcript_19967/g.27100 Transcript_19967/m.27100 type:complete len:92 (-) Transcript_19967:353-628(-)